MANKAPTTKEEEQIQVDELRAALGPLEGYSAVFCTDACLNRYLRARNWNAKKAEKMLRDTLKWRAQYKPEEIKWEDVAHEAETGKMYRTRFQDKQGDVVLVLAPGRQNTNSHEGQIKHLVYCLENAVNCLPGEGEKMVWLIDFRGWTLKMSPPMKTTRETLNILQNHFPERLKIAVLYNSPTMFEAFWRMVKPFMDPKTVKKVCFINPRQANKEQILEEMFDLETLDSTFGGRATWSYDHTSYGEMMREDDRRRAEELAKAASGVAVVAVEDGRLVSKSEEATVGGEDEFEDATDVDDSTKL
eukprot:TRINITY_DN32618_c0_g1_i1.p1 TRINITY_DN32618_c0_g1~~TRINITY_DN32618_c0_g1_i1.p1  ORF type:complete len:303 (+),score=62.06 TRINITY_DN32618_c0_g1_i1:218-1126(+)